MLQVTTEDRLPKIICEECCKRIEAIHKFATMAVKNQYKFKKLGYKSHFYHKHEDVSDNKGLLHTYLTKVIYKSHKIDCNSHISVFKGSKL